MDVLRVLHVVPYFDDAWAYGGIPRAVTALTAGLARRQHAVTVVTTDVRDARLRSRAGRTGTARGVSVHRFPNLSNALAYHLQLFAPLGLGRWLARHAGEFDVAHLHGCRHLPGAIAARHLARAGVPWALSPHGTAPLIERRRLAKRLFDRLIGARALEDAAVVIATTEAERRDLAALGLSPAHLRIVANALDLDEFDDPVPRGAARARFALGRASVVLFLGKLTPRKRVDLLIRAFADLPNDAELVIAGNDMGAGRGARAHVRHSGLERRTVFTGLLEGRARLEALADSDVLVYPGEHEIFGLVPLEALMLGVPVVVAGGSGCGEVIAEVGGGIVVPPGDPAALARAIAAVLGDLGAWRAEAGAAATRIRERYGPERIAADTERVYSVMLDGAAHRVAASAP